MKYRKMLGDTIYRLRKAKGLSQSELGRQLGVSNKAVSKWETDEANPDIGLLPLLAEALGVTVDELLTDVRIEKKDFSVKEATVFGFKGIQTKTDEKYEFVSDKTTKKGTPYLHINIGKQASTFNAKARGIIAIGNNAKGVIAIGLVAVGLFSLGLLAVGFLALGILAVGMLTLGSVAVGGFAAGGVAVGAVAFGGVAVGYVSFGGVSVGYYAHTGVGGFAAGKHISILGSVLLRDGGFLK